VSQRDFTRLMGGWILLILGATQLARVVSLSVFASRDGNAPGWAAIVIQVILWLAVAVVGLRLVIRGNRGSSPHV